MRNYLIIIVAIVFSSCAEKKIVENVFLEEIVEGGGSYLKKTKDMFIESDASKNEKRMLYLENMIKQNPEYKYVISFFEKSNNPYVLEEGGDLYKIIDSQVDDSGSTLYKYEEDEVLKYFYKTKNHFYLYSLSIRGKDKVECLSVRRVGDGMFKTAMHDIAFDENHKIIKEDYKGEFSTKFFEKDANQYFRFSNKVNGDKVVNTLNLGPVKNF